MSAPEAHSPISTEGIRQRVEAAGGYLGAARAMIQNTTLSNPTRAELWVEEALAWEDKIARTVAEMPTGHEALRELAATADIEAYAATLVIPTLAPKIQRAKLQEPYYSSLAPAQG